MLKRPTRSSSASGSVTALRLLVKFERMNRKSKRSRRISISWSDQHESGALEPQVKTERLCLLLGIRRLRFRLTGHHRHLLRHRVRRPQFEKDLHHKRLYCRQSLRFLRAPNPALHHQAICPLERRRYGLLLRLIHPVLMAQFFNLHQEFLRLDHGHYRHHNLLSRL